MLASHGSLSPRQSYPGYAVPRDLPRLPSRQPSPPLDHPRGGNSGPSQWRRLSACCLPVTASKTYGGYSADGDNSRGITRRALLYSRHVSINDSRTLAGFREDRRVPRDAPRTGKGYRCYRGQPASAFHVKQQGHPHDRTLTLRRSDVIA